MPCFCPHRLRTSRAGREPDGARGEVEDGKHAKSGGDGIGRSGDSEGSPQAPRCTRPAVPFRGLAAVAFTISPPCSWPRHMRGTNSTVQGSRLLEWTHALGLGGPADRAYEGTRQATCSQLFLLSPPMSSVPG